MTGKLYLTMAMSKDLRLIAFRVGSETFVVDIMAVRQIIKYGGTTPVPTAPSFVEGIMILRNEVIPIVDMRDRLNATADRAEKPLVLITDTSAGPIGLKVDEVRRIVNVGRDSLLPPPPLVRAIRGELLIAIVHQDDEVYLLVDVDAVLSSDEKMELRSADLASVAERV
ncbi:MAG TPA: chemotaxis protein CheW [Thermoanaerobaculia bacterium]|nr:chemotaxis protein CheW [Thermoanaerobaculia bacterium]